MQTRVERLVWSASIVAKIGSKHGLSTDDVEDAVFNAEAAWWDYDPERGRRLFVRGRNEHGRQIRVVLFPVDGDPCGFRVGTAM